MTLSNKVLIVDDEPFVRDIASRVILDLKLGLEVLTARNSEEAMGILNSKDVGLALIDNDLKDSVKGTTGPLVAKAASGLGVHFIVTSSLLKEDAEQLFGRYGPRAYVRKPFKLDLLEAEVKALYSL